MRFHSLWLSLLAFGFAQSGLASDGVGSSETVITWLHIKIVLFFLLINVLVSIYLHKTEKLVIYADYTDATFTSLSPLAFVIPYFTMVKVFEISPEISATVSAILFLIPLYFVVKSTYRNNRDSTLFFIMSLTTKLTIIIVYYVIMIALLMSSGSAKRKGESQAAYEARLRREAKERQAMMAMLTIAFVWLSEWVCRVSEFSDWGEYFAPTE